MQSLVQEETFEKYSFEKGKERDNVQICALNRKRAVLSGVINGLKSCLDVMLRVRNMLNVGNQAWKTCVFVRGAQPTRDLGEA